MLRRAMTLTVSVVAVIALLLPEAASAFGYKDTGFDEREGRQVNLDIRSTTRKVWASPDGRRWLNVRVRSYDPLGDDWFAGVKIDSRGGPLKDYRLFVYWHVELGSAASDRGVRSIGPREPSLMATTPRTPGPLQGSPPLGPA